MSWATIPPHSSNLRICTPWSVNGFAFALYERHDGSFHGLPLQVLTIRQGQVATITGFVKPELLTFFRIPPTLPLAG
jgi:hypothetical protein